MDEEDLVELAPLAFMAMAAIVIFIARRMFGNRAVDAERVRMTGGPDEYDVVVVKGATGRRYVAIEYIVPGDDDRPDKDMQVLLTSAEAAKLASHLRVASQRRGTLTMARVAARRAAQTASSAARRQ